MNKIFDRFISFICKQSLKRPFLWLISALILSIPAVMELSRIGLDTDLIRLLPEHSRAAVLKKKMDNITSGSGGFFAVLLESKDREKLNQAFTATVSRLNKVEGIGNLEYRNPADFYKTYRYVLVPSSFLDKVLDFFIRLEAKVNPMAEDLLSDNVSESTEGGNNKEEEDKKDIKKMMRFLDLPEFHQSEDGQVMAVKVFPKKGITSLGKTRKIFRELSDISQEISHQYGVWSGVGGSLRNSIDQYDFIIADLARSGTITLVTVLLALIIGFRSIRILPVVLVPLALGLIWTMGSIPFLVGDLNTITSFLMLVSFGLGIDFSLHLVKRFQLERKEKKFEEALFTTFRSTGKSIVISGLTTALSLFILAFSNFRGFSEFGIVGGFSLIMILLAMILFLPAVIVAGLKTGLLPSPQKQRLSGVPVPIPSVTLVLAGMMGVSLLVGGLGLRFNYDFSKMDVSVPQEKDIKERFYKVYESVRSPGAVFAVQGLDSLDKFIDVLDRKKDDPASRIQRFHSIRELCPDDVEYRKRLSLLRDIKEVIKGRWVDRVEDKDYKKWIEDLRNWSPTEARPRFEDLPDRIKERFASKSNPEYYIVPVYIKGEKQKGKNAMAFSQELFNLDVPGKEKIVGPFGETTVLADVLHVVTREGPWLVIATFLGIFLLIWLNQRSILQTLWIILPLITGLGLTAGIMVVCGLSLNFFNIVVFPTLIGMGVDDGVHYYRRWIENAQDTDSCQKELFGPLSMTTVTTVFGYVGIAFSNHPGLQSIGILACIGLFCTWFSSLFLLPGLLKLLSKKKPTA